MWLVAVACLALAACSGAEPAATVGEPEIANQGIAVAFAWAAVGGPGDAPPVRWVDGVPCKGRKWPAIELGDICAAGMWDGRAATLVRVLPEFGLPIADSGLVHEFMHAALQFNDGDPDSAHASAEWSAVEPAKALLREAGL